MVTLATAYHWHKNLSSSPETIATEQQTADAAAQQAHEANVLKRCERHADDLLQSKVNQAIADSNQGQMVELTIHPHARTKHIETCISVESFMPVAAPPVQTPDIPVAGSVLSLLLIGATGRMLFDRHKAKKTIATECPSLHP